MLISHKSAYDSQKTSGDIWWHGHKLSQLRGMSHAADDGWEEDGDRVDGQEYPDGDKHVHPDFPIHEGVVDELGVKFVGQN